MVPKRFEGFGALKGHEAVVEEAVVEEAVVEEAVEPHSGPPEPHSGPSEPYMTVFENPLLKNLIATGPIQKTLVYCGDAVKSFSIYVEWLFGIAFSS